ncbi:hypothetical protein HAX54_015899 [Datura stramonium]|uniref:Histone H2A n=1 Tax=Datura stramonium TaxID=4076 RepID=A0ABS8UHZ6_DATST|nr:hypothetical protein [Datura stramonium]
MAGKWGGGGGLVVGKTTTAASSKKEKDKKNKISHSSRAGLQFPVGRIHCQLKTRISANGRIGATSTVYSAAILEYLTTKVLELAGLASLLKITYMSKLWRSTEAVLPIPSPLFSSR